ncbi:polynucleotide kinase [Erwinia phage Cronus]|uniref:Polynucleotide kinase n=1 Tax=Erwinia phage Cronus TaxID=2163633 RepID=A0A2S1GLW3_9CAUD|nr:polynucleotide kinase [Erwinia phage Cronus]AWD90381.1 polynucleotide kinase [Erwinia phage Cronus]
MKELYVTVGCPGSGKSTWANEFVKTNPGYFIVSRDDFREKLFGHDARDEYRYSKQKEKSVSIAQMNTAAGLMALEGTKGVIIADTNLNPITFKTWYNFAIDNGYKFCRKDFHVPWTELVKRNERRGTKAVPIDVLRRMYKDYEVTPYNPDDYDKRPQAVVFDLDGTLAKMANRSPYDLEKCGEDVPNEMVVQLAKLYKAQGYKILAVSGRESGTKQEPTRYYDMTAAWLKENGVPYDAHFQRKQGDSRKDDIIKEEIFWNEIVENYDVVLAVDDRNQVVEMWRRLGIECWQVDHGDF